MEFINNYSSCDNNDDNNNSAINNLTTTNKNKTEYICISKQLSQTNEEIICDNIIGISYIMGGSTGISGVENQDMFCFCDIVKKKIINDEEILSKIKLIVVCDGHGLYGQKIASIITSEFTEVIISNLSNILTNVQSQETQKFLKDLFINFNNDIIYERFHNKLGGSTCTLIIDTNDFVICANIGDCDAHIKYDFSSIKSTNNKVNTDNLISESKITESTTELINISHICNCIETKKNCDLIDLSHNHGVMNVDEIKRIYAIGSHINVRYSMRPFNRSDKPKHKNAIEQLVWVRNTKNAPETTNSAESDSFSESEFAKSPDFDITYNPPTTQPRLYFNSMKKEYAAYIHNDNNCSRSNLSRSFGDFNNEYVIAEPIISIVYHPSINETDKKVPYKIITGTDGFFNCYSNDEFKDLVSLNAKSILNHCFDKVGLTFGRKYADNTTVIVLTNNYS
jgi:serine/threonine protein phosphatase PrpC